MIQHSVHIQLLDFFLAILYGKFPQNLLYNSPYLSQGNKRLGHQYQPVRLNLRYNFATFSKKLVLYILQAQLCCFFISFASAAGQNKRKEGYFRNAIKTIQHQLKCIYLSQWLWLEQRRETPNVFLFYRTYFQMGIFIAVFLSGLVTGESWMNFWSNVNMHCKGSIYSFIHIVSYSPIFQESVSQIQSHTYSNIHFFNVK